MFFTIEQDNNITAHATLEDGEAYSKATPDVDNPVIRSLADLTSASSTWPKDRLLAIYNSIPGVKPTKKFTDRKSGLARVWKAIQSLVPAPTAAPSATKAAKPGKKASAAKKATRRVSSDDRQSSKKGMVTRMIQQPGGATLASIMKATDWQRHTVRGFIATLGKTLPIISENVEGERTYFSKER